MSALLLQDEPSPQPLRWALHRQYRPDDHSDWHLARAACPLIRLCLVAVFCLFFNVGFVSTPSSTSVARVVAKFVSLLNCVFSCWRNSSYFALLLILICLLVERMCLFGHSCKHGGLQAFIDSVCGIVLYSRARPRYLLRCIPALARSHHLFRLIAAGIQHNNCVPFVGYSVNAVSDHSSLSSGQQPSRCLCLPLLNARPTCVVQGYLVSVVCISIAQTAHGTV